MSADRTAGDPAATAVAIDAAKEAAGRAAAALVEPGMRVGLGTGSTVHWTIVALGERAAELGLTCVATSDRTHELAVSLGLQVVSPDEARHLDIAIDGADEVDPGANLTKGGGGAHTREKIVATMADRFVVVVDESKVVPALGPFGTPLEVLDFAPGVVTDALAGLGAERIAAEAERRTDNGNLLMRAYFPPITDPVGLAARLAAVPGIVEHGLFLGSIVDDVFVAGTDGVRHLPGGRRR
jgi:ribose 5-phosphate isomerase A